MEHETLWQLLTDTNHWLLELIILVITDGLIGIVLWPLVIKPRWQSWRKHHKSDDDRTKKLEDRMMKLEQKLETLMK